MDFHAQQIQGFFEIPADHLFAAPVLLDYIKGKKIKDLTIVSPDVGSVSGESVREAPERRYSRSSTREGPRRTSPK